MIFVVITLGVVLLVLYFGKSALSRQFGKEVKAVFADGINISAQVYHLDQLAGLPPPVRRYFELVLKAGQPYISFARMTHEGQFKTGKKNGWVSIMGEQYAAVDLPGFVWKGQTALFTARDMYLAGKGRLVVTILGLLKMMDGRGPQYDQGELLRWLGESVLYPTNLLPGKRTSWEGIDEGRAKLLFHYNGLSLFFLVRFNDLGEITELETKRYKDKESLETWVINVKDYKEMNTVRVPTAFEVLWRLKEGDLSYAKFNMTAIEYGIPERF